MCELNMKPCPFCGGRATKVCHKNNEPFPWEVACSVCGGSVGYYMAESEAVAAWNRRPHNGHTCGECENLNEGNGKSAWCPSAREVVAFSDKACSAFVAKAGGAE